MLGFQAGSWDYITFAAILILVVAFPVFTCSWVCPAVSRSRAGTLRPRP
jgi:hypothetical protein